MIWSRHRISRSLLPSELGFLKVTGREPGISLRDAFLNFRDLVSSDMDWADNRKRRFRRNASWTRGGTLALTAASTVILGIQAIPSRATIALPLVALVTVIGGFEEFFNWRPRWILMEECQYRFNRLRDDMDYYIVLTQEPDLTRQHLDSFFKEQQSIWADISKRWVEFRKLERSHDGNYAPHQQR
jgi:hypothetical protein